MATRALNEDKGEKKMETVNQEVVQNDTAIEKSEERTFTQAELDEIVESRLHRERSKFSDYEDIKLKAQKYDEAQEASKTELEKANDRVNALQAQLDSLNKEKELHSIREKVAQTYGIPIHLLQGETEEVCSEQAKAILEFSKKGSYPTLKDGGEVSETPKITKADILSIKNEKERLKAIQENIHLFK